MKVLQLVSGRVLTGPAAAAFADALALREAGHAVWLGGRGGRQGEPVEEAARRAGLAFWGDLRPGRGVDMLLRLPASVRRLRELLRQESLAAVHAHRVAEQLLALLALGRKRKVSLVRSWHRDPALLPAPLLQRLAKGCDACVCVAREHAATLRAAGARAAEFIPPSVDLNLFRPAPQPQVSAPPRLGLIGRWKRGEDRGQRAFLDILRRLDPGLPWRAVLLGRGEGREELQALLAAHPARERIEMEETGASYPDQAARLSLGFVFATGADGSSRPALELLACGVPLLLADRPGLRELGEETDCAEVLPAADGEAWTAACENLLRRPEARLARSLAARRRAETAHAPLERGRKLAALYGLGPAS